jgi:hypothetical protein
MIKMSYRELNGGFQYALMRLMEVDMDFDNKLALVKLRNELIETDKNFIAVTEGSTEEGLKKEAERTFEIGFNRLPVSMFKDKITANDIFSLQPILNLEE